MPKLRVEMAVVLNYVNRIRQALLIGQGTPLDQLPKGKIGDTKSCVIAVALSNGWKCRASEATLTLYHNGNIDVEAAVTALRELGFKVVRRNQSIDIETPTMIENFIMRFDAGDFPDLVLTDNRGGWRG